MRVGTVLTGPAERAHSLLKCRDAWTELRICIAPCTDHLPIMHERTVGLSGAVERIAEYRVEVGLREIIIRGFERSVQRGLQYRNRISRTSRGDEELAEFEIDATVAVDR